MTSDLWVGTYAPMIGFTPPKTMGLPHPHSSPLPAPRTLFLQYSITIDFISIFNSIQFSPVQQAFKNISVVPGPCAKSWRHVRLMVWTRTWSQSHTVPSSGALRQTIEQGCQNAGRDLELGTRTPPWQTPHAGALSGSGGPCPPGSPVWYFGHSRNSIDACRNLS